MPCNSDYMEASAREVAMSQVCCLLDEIRTGKHVNAESSAWRGYHPSIYCVARSKAGDDALVARLCDYLKKHGVEGRSLEMQMWWRDHRKADAARRARAAKDKETARLRRQGLAKLSQAEREALGLKEEQS